MRYEEATAKAIHAAGMQRVRETPAPKEQKFSIGSFVWISKDLGKYMWHWPRDCIARVEHTYAHAFGGDGNHHQIYCLLVRNDDGEWHEHSWYYEDQLTQFLDEKYIEECRKEIESYQKS